MVTQASEQIEVKNFTVDATFSFISCSTEMKAAMLCDILIIDDDVDDAEFLSEAFIHAGVTNLEFVSCAEEAFELLHKLRTTSQLPSLIITDFYMSGLTGAQFASDLKAISAYQHVPVVMLSSPKSKSEINLYLQMGIDEYWVKPSSLDAYVKLAVELRDKFCEI